MIKILITGGSPSITRIMLEKLAKERDLDLTGVEIVKREFPVPHLVPFTEGDSFVNRIYPERKKDEFIHILPKHMYRQDNYGRNRGKRDLKNVNISRQKTYSRHMGHSG